MPPKPHTQRNTGRQSYRRNTPHPNKSNKPNTNAPATHSSNASIGAGATLLQDLKDFAGTSGIPDIQKAYDMLKHILPSLTAPSITAPTHNKTQFLNDFKKKGFDEIDPVEIKKQLEEYSDVTIENPVEIIANAENISKDRDKLIELNKEYITLMEDLNMPSSFYK